MSDSLHTSKFGTSTREGFIFHRKTESGVKLPVKLDFLSERVEGAHFPLRKDGNLVFALPGGGEFIEPVPTPDL